MTVTEERVGFPVVAREQLPRLYALARQLVGQRAEDVVQECLTKAYKNFEDLRNVEAAPAWFRSILINCARDRFRREAAGIDETPIEDVDEISLYRRIAEEDPFPYSDSVHLDFLHSFTDDDVWAVLERIRPKYRVPLVLVHMEGMTTREVAGLLGAPLNTLLSWLHRGRKHFEAELWDYANSHGLLKRKARRAR
jgi:RNA polymerase sigma-70 factor, ECF subfamily